MSDITCCPRKIRPEPCRPGRRATGGLPFPITKAARKPTETAGHHPRRGAAAPTKT